MFSEKDLKQFSEAGIAAEQVENQINNFKKGFPFLKVTAPCTVEYGIKKPAEGNIDIYTGIYDRWQGSRMKFVPASGAASRMFKSLYEMMNSGGEENKAAVEFFKSIDGFAFYDELKALMKSKDVYLGNLDNEGKLAVLHGLLDADGMNYGGKPKGLLTFHKYADSVRTAFEEHLVEAALYAKTNDKRAVLHFTVSPEHRDGFLTLLRQVMPIYEKQYDVMFNVSFSEQKKSTDTVAVTPDNEPFRNDDGTILFRPAGHGALLENLNNLDCELVFIKNIDNVTVESNIADTVKMKKALAGVLIKSKNLVFDYLEKLDAGNTSPALIDEIKNFIDQTFCIKPVLPEEPKEAACILHGLLNRPIRVCGMVKNEGEPGGGPFIANDSEGRQSPQIAESSQIDMANAAQKSIFDASTHFNPVDLICYLKDYKGNKFDLWKYSDPEAGFISSKTKDGKELKAQELPGLWNGAMSNWNTVFVETPLNTFNPVKTVNDLLKKQHKG